MARINPRINHANIAKMVSEIQASFDDQGPIRIPVETTMPSSSIAKFQQQRNQFLVQLYERQATSDVRNASAVDIGESLGFDVDTLDRVVEALEQQGHISQLTFDRGVHLSASGVLHVERLAAEPGSSPSTIHNTTNYFSGNIVDSQVATGANSKQEQTNVAVNIDMTALGELVDLARRFETDLLGPADRNDFAADIAVIEEQLASPTQPVSRLRSSLRSLHALVIGATGSTVGGAMATIITERLL